MIRFFDILFSSLALLVLSPLLLVVMIILRFTGEGEVFFRQSRVGKDGKKFEVIKFATMLKASPHMGTGTVTIKNDPRILPMGRFLRKTKINELPQLINVFKGDMSIIGPRPQDQRCFDAFREEDKAEILKVRPGLSGIGAIYFRDEENLLQKAQGDMISFYDTVISPYKGRLEAWWVQKQSLTNYFLLIFLTLWVIFFPTSTMLVRLHKDLPQPPQGLAEVKGKKERGSCLES
jgi:lipopolysaccharide/colanic/teichoic acid biosynthesis glycosyltransferase